MTFVPDDWRSELEQRAQLDAERETALQKTAAARELVQRHPKQSSTQEIGNLRDSTPPAEIVAAHQTMEALDRDVHGWLAEMKRNTEAIAGLEEKRRKLMLTLAGVGAVAVFVMVIVIWANFAG